MSAHIYGPGPNTLRDFVLQQGLFRLGGLSPAQNIAFMFDDLDTDMNNVGLATGWQWTPTGSGNLAFGTLNDEAGGVQESTSGATAASRGQNRTLSAFIRAGGTVPWYCAFRQKITTAITAQSKAFSGLINTAANLSISAGFFGALSLTNYVAQYDGNEAGSFIDLGIAVDTAYHVFELWCLGDGKLHAAIDFGADKGPATMAGAPTDSLNGQRIIMNGTDAVARTKRDDWFCMLAKRS